MLDPSNYLRPREVWAEDLPRPSTASVSVSMEALSSELVLCEHWESHEPSQYTLGDLINRKGEETSETAITKWLQSFCKDEDIVVEETHATVNEMLKKLAPLSWSTTIKPDLTVSLKREAIRKENDAKVEWKEDSSEVEREENSSDVKQNEDTSEINKEFSKFPVLLFEVHSSPYVHSVNKIYFDLIEHLRWMRNGNPNIIKCSGYVFPKFGDEEKGSVSLATAEWSDEEMMFFCTCDLLELDEKKIKAKIESTYVEQLGMVRSLTEHGDFSCQFVLPLLSNELHMKNFGTSEFFSIPSRQSMLVLTKEKLFKYIVHSKEQTSLRNLGVSEAKKQYLLPSETQLICGKVFFVYPVLNFPLKRDEVKLCFHSFFESLRKAIDSLHRDLDIAHLDIRLENVCFRGDDAVLIDLDRAHKRERPTRFLGYWKTGSVMYSVPDGFGRSFTAENLDWRQLGLLIEHVSSKRSWERYHVYDIRRKAKLSKQTGKVKDLLEGRTPTEFERKDFKRPGEKTLSAVLDSRKLNSELD